MTTRGAEPAYPSESYDADVDMDTVKPTFVLVRDYGHEGLRVCGVTFDQGSARAWLAAGIYSDSSAVCVAWPERFDGENLAPVTSADALLAELERTR